MAYVGATILFLWRIVVSGMVPTSYDLLTYFYPYKADVAEVVRQGQLPLWNPLIFMGVPLLANIQAAVLYPPDFLFYLWPTVDALRYSIFLHLFLGAVFTYLFGRLSLGLPPAAAWVAGAVFGYSGYLGAQIGHLNQLHAAVWLPILLLCLEKATRGRSPRAASLGALAVAVQLLAGHTQLAYYSGWVLLAFALFLALFGVLNGRGRLVPLAALAFMMVVGVAVAGVQLLPTLELAQQSYRSGGIPFNEAANFSVRFPKLLDSVLPLYDSVPYVEFIGYTGVIPLVLLPAAVVARRRPAYQWFFSGLAGVALLLALGDSTRVYGWLYQSLPGFDLFRVPARWLYVYNFSVALLSGMAVQSLRAPISGDSLRRWLGAYGLALAGGVALLTVLRFWLDLHDQGFILPAPRVVFAWWLFSSAAVALSLAVRSRPRSKLAVGLLVALLLLDLHMARGPLEYNNPIFCSLYTTPRPIYGELPGAPSFRVLSLAREPFALADEWALRAELSTGLDKDGLDSYLNYTRLKEALTPDLGMAFGLNTVDGYDGGLLPTSQYAKFKQLLVGGGDEQPDLTLQAQAKTVPSSRLLGALGVRYLLVGPSMKDWDSGWVGTSDLDFGGVRVLRNSQALPRAYVVHSVQVLPDERQQLEAVRTLDLQQVVVLGQQVDYQAPQSPGKDEVGLIRDDADEVDVEVSLEQPGLLVLSDSYYPGWNAYLDGRKVPLLRADYALRAVQLEAGTHRVRFSYEPQSLRLGLALSALGLLVTAGTFLAPRWRKVAEADDPVETLEDRN